MKTCPVCAARCFDDMETCYGCMHRFGEGGNSQCQDVASGFLGDDCTLPLAKKGEGDAPALEPMLSGRTEGFAGTTLVDETQGACARWELVVSLRPVGQAAVGGADC